MKTSLASFITCTFFSIICSSALLAQNYTVSGYVRDANSSEALIGANVYDSATYQGTITNNYGFYSISLPPGRHTITYSFVGYAPIRKQIDLQGNRIMNTELTSGELLEEVVVKADARDLVESTQMSSHRIKMLEIKKMPALFGEVDIMKSIQKLPGVQSGNEGFSGVFVRGGDPSQNLILLDGVPVYNVNHLFGFFSVFNADAINDVKLIKGGFPARYGGRLSSVIDIRMKEGNMKKLQVEGAVGLLSTKLTVSGPIIKDKTSFIVSGRRSYFDLFGRAYTTFKKTDATGGFWFGDLSAKINHKFSDKDRFYLSAYLGEDKFYFLGDTDDQYSSERYDVGLKWGNTTSALRWNHVFSGRLFSNTTVTYSRFRFLNELEFVFEDKMSDQYFSHRQEFLSGVEDLTIKEDIDFYPNTQHQIKMGAEYTYHKYSPGVSSRKTEATDIENFDDKKGSNIYGHEIALFVEDNWEINDVFKTNLGLRYSHYFVSNRSYSSIEPRFSLRGKLSNSFSLKGSVANMKQYIHLLTNSSITLPTDLWVPATEKVPPQSSWQYALGANWMVDNTLNFNLEGYYKDMTNVIAYKEGAQFVPTDQNWQNKIASGRGWSYGLEFLGEKNWENTKLSLAYTLSWSYRKFDEINNGESYPFKYDRRHDINLSFTHKFSERFDVALNWIYATGNAFTIPFESYQDPGDPFHNYSYYYDEYVTEFDSRNNYRAPAYHRLDVGVNLHKEKKWGFRTWSFSVFNAYGRYNPVFMIVEDDDSGDMVLTQYTIFRFVPSISYRFRFK